MPRTPRTRRSPSPPPPPDGSAPAALDCAKEDAYRWIARRTRTREEVRAKLRRRGHREDVIEETLTHLAGLGYVDDAAFAREWCRCRLESHPVGARALRRELIEKGVAPALSEAALAEAFEGADEADLATRLALERAGKGLDLQTPKGLRRLRDFLLRRGFSSESVHEALAAVASPTADPPAWEEPDGVPHED